MASQEKPAPSSTSKPTATETSKTEKVLFGDDNMRIIESVTRMLRGRKDLEFKCVNNPDEFIAKARTGKYSLIITDLNYTGGGQEGFRVLEALADIKTRKILCTANADDPEVIERARSLGVELLDKTDLGKLFLE